MTLELLGTTIHEADVALTDVGLFLLGGWIATRLWAIRAPGTVARDGALINAALAVAALGGALFHAFFPAKVATAGGRAIWLLTTSAIAVATGAMLALALRLLRPTLSMRVRRTLAVVIVVAFIATIAFVDPSYGTVVRFYGPVLLLLLVAAARAARGPTPTGWSAVTLGLLLSVVAALLQQQRIALDPVWFDHNAVYHVVQAVALVVLARGLRVARA